MLRSTANIVRTGGAAIAVLTILSACGTSSGAELEAPGNAPAAFSSAEVLAGADPFVDPNPDNAYAPGHQFFFTNDIDGETTLFVMLQTDEIEPLSQNGPTGELRDGTPAAVVDNSGDDDRMSTITFDRTDRTRVSVASLTFTPQQLIALIDGVEFPSEGAITEIDGHTLAVAMPQPFVVDGYTTAYDLDGGASVSIEIHTMLADEYPLWDFGATDRTTVLDGTDAVIARPERTGNLMIAFRYPDTDYFVRVTVSPGDGGTGPDYVVAEDDLDDIIDAIELRQPAVDELR